MLTRHIPLVASCGKGEVLAVFDGVGSAPFGMRAAQTVADALLAFYTEAEPKKMCSREDSAYSHDDEQYVCELMEHLTRAHTLIRSWGNMEKSDRPLGAAAGSVVWITDDSSAVEVFHAGDTVVLLVSEDGSFKTLSSLDQSMTGELINYFGSSSMNIYRERSGLIPGDRILLASDGVSRVLGNRQLSEMSCSAPDLKVLCHRVLSICQQSTGDDITLMAYDVE